MLDCLPKNVCNTDNNNDPALVGNKGVNLTPYNHPGIEVSLWTLPLGLTAEDTMMSDVIGEAHLLGLLKGPLKRFHNKII